MSDSDQYPAAPEGSVRLNKFLASCGYESRRAADRLIAEGRVEVNGQVVATPGLRVMPADFVKVDGKHAVPKEEIVLLLNKPRGFVCSREAQGAEGTVFDLLPPKYRYANYVGRLDADSEGLLLFTNNGSLAQGISHPGSGVEKEYWVTLDQAFETSVLIQLLKGVRIPEGQAKAKYVSRLSARRACVVLEQGLKRQVRQMFSCLGLRVRKLVRVRIGSLWGGDLEPGHCALLTPEQIKEASTNPKPRKGLMGRAQVLKRKTVTPATINEPEEEDENYVFNPADFETEEEALSSATKFTDSEAFEPERAERRPFGKAPRNRREESGRRSLGEHRSFGDRKSFGNRRFNGESDSFGNSKKNFGERRSFGNRKFDGEHRSYGNRKSFGERRFDGERRSFSDRKSFDKRRSFDDRRSSGERRFDGERRSFSNRKFDSEHKSFGKRRSFSVKKSFGNRGGFRRDGGSAPFGRDR